jgi:arginine N-succinyltransferase
MEADMSDRVRDWPIRPATAGDVGGLIPLLPAPGQGGSLLPPAGGPAAREWLLVATQDVDASVAGCVRVRRAIGLDRPRFWYHVGCAVHAAPELELFHRQRTLLLGNDLTGAWEIADLVCDAATLDTEAQVTLLRRLLRAALALIVRQRAADPTVAAAEPTVICELPGLRDTAGRSPFWDSLGRRFYDGDPLLAAERFGPAWKTHVAALLPHEPLLVSFLPHEAQAALGAPGRGAEAAARVLHETGLRAGRHVTLDDAGPVYEGDLDLLGA